MKRGDKMDAVETRKNGLVDLQTLAEEINQEHRKCKEAFSKGLQHAISAGKLLIQAKG